MKKLMLVAVIALLGLNANAEDLGIIHVKGKKINGMYKGGISAPSGLSLYVFDPDQGSAKPACNATCAEKWPPHILTDAEIAKLADLTLSSGVTHGVIVRASGLNQLTLNGRPVYTFFHDRTDEDALGDGLGGVWHLMTSGN